MDAQDPFVPNRIAVYTSTAPSDLYNRLAPMSTPLTFARNFKLFLGRKERTVAEFLKKVSVSVFYDSSSLQFPSVVGKLNKPYILVRKNEVSDITAWLKIQAKPKAKSFEQFIPAVSRKHLHSLCPSKAQGAAGAVSHFFHCWRARLSCQIIYAPELDGLSVELPEAA